MSKQIIDQIYGCQADQSTNMPVMTFNLLISYSHIGNRSLFSLSAHKSVPMREYAHLGLLLQFCSLDAMLTYLKYSRKNHARPSKCFK